MLINELLRLNESKKFLVIASVDIDYLVDDDNPAAGSNKTGTIKLVITCDGKEEAKELAIQLNGLDLDIGGINVDDDLLSHWGQYAFSAVSVMSGKITNTQVSTTSPILGKHVFSANKNDFTIPNSKASNHT